MNSGVGTTRIERNGNMMIRVTFKVKNQDMYFYTIMPKLCKFEDSLQKEYFLKKLVCKEIFAKTVLKFAEISIWKMLLIFFIQKSCQCWNEN